MKTKRPAIYLRVSTSDQNTDNQERELRQVAEPAGWTVVKVYKDRAYLEPRDAISDHPLTRYGAMPPAESSISSWSGRSIGSAAHCKTWSAFLPSFTRSRSTFA